MPWTELTASDGHRLQAHRADSTVDGEQTSRGGVVVIQEIFGVNSHIRSVVDQLAADGFVAMAPALFDRVEPGVELGYDGPGVKRGQALAWETVGIDDALTDIAAAADLLATELGGPARVGLVGFCYGGMLAAAAASRMPDRIGRAVAYYPSLAAQKLPDDVPGVPLLVHLGDRDQRVTVEDGETLRQRWPDAEFHRYDAGHGFHCDQRPGFDADAATTAWRRTIDFLGPPGLEPSR